MSKNPDIHTDEETEAEKHGGRTQVQLPGPVKEYIRERAEEEGKTHSEILRDVLPEESIEISIDEVDIVRVTNDVHDRLSEMAGDRVSRGDVAALFVFADVVERGDYEVSHAVFDTIPRAVLDVLESLESDNE